MIHKTSKEIQEEFHPTMELRWIYYGRKKTLQQKFRNQKVNFEWREIPTV